MATNTKTDLLACPFCGHEKIRIKQEGGGLCSAVCDRCVASGPLGLSKKQAEAEWNKRVEPAEELPFGAMVAVVCAMASTLKVSGPIRVAFINEAMADMGQCNIQLNLRTLRLLVGRKFLDARRREFVLRKTKTASGNIYRINFL